MMPKDKQSFLEARRQQALETTASWFHAGVEAAEDWAAMQAKAQPAPEVFSNDVVWDFANKVRSDLDRKSCPGVFMHLAMESINRHYPARQPAPDVVALLELARNVAVNEQMLAALELAEPYLEWMLINQGVRGKFPADLDEIKSVIAAAKAARGAK